MKKEMGKPRKRVNKHTINKGVADISRTVVERAMKKLEDTSLDYLKGRIIANTFIVGNLLRIVMHYAQTTKNTELERQISDNLGYAVLKPGNKKMAARPTMSGMRDEYVLSYGISGIALPDNLKELNEAVNKATGSNLFIG